MSHSSHPSRITYKSVQPNPLFLKWLEEFQTDAIAKGNNSQYSVKEAIKSLKRYPIPIETADECAILKGFGKYLCAYLDRRLKQHRSSINENLATNNIHPPLTTTKDDPPPTKKQKRQTKPFKPSFRSGGYAILIALLEHMNENPANVFLSKDDLIEKAQPHSEESFTRPKPDSHYTAWSTMTRLVSKGFINRVRKKKAEFSLTDEGYLLALELQNLYKDKPRCIDIMGDDFTCFKTAPSSSSVAYKVVSKVDEKINSVSFSSISTSLSKPSDNKRNFGGNCLTRENDELKLINAEENYSSFESIPSTSGYQSNQELSQKTVSTITDVIEIDDDDKVETYFETVTEKPVGDVEIDDSDDIFQMAVGSFDVMLLIDKSETSGAARKDDAIVIQINKYSNLKHEYRHLKLGDFLWIAKHRSTGKELVLPYIVERKRMDDLGSSIKDGRFHEQKYRLKRCGLKTVIYLVENYGKNKNVGLPIQSLMQAVSNTRFQDGFRVHTTDSLSGSVRFLAIMTKRLSIEYETKALKGCSRESGNNLMTFDYFNKASAKNKPLTVRQTFIKMLLQLKGMSLEKAVAITDVYGTPLSLMNKYQTCSDKEGELLLAKLKFDKTSQCVGPAISKVLYKLFTLEVLP